MVWDCSIVMTWFFADESHDHADDGSPVGPWSRGTTGEAAIRRGRVPGRG